MKFRLACGHTTNVGPYTNWFRVIRDGCMRCYLEAKAQAKADAEKEKR